MSAEQITELLTILRDLHSLAGAVVAGVGTLLGIALWFIMFHATGRSGFWGGCVLVACCLLPNASYAADWSNNDYEDEIYSATSGTVWAPDGGVVTNWWSIGGNLQNHFQSWWRSGNPIWPPKTAANVYANKLAYDYNNRASYTSWAATITVQGFTAPTINVWASLGTTVAQRQDHWTTWRTQNPGSGLAASAYSTALVADAAAGRLLPVSSVPADYTSWAALITSAGFTAPTQAEWSAFGTTAAQRLTHWQTWRKYYPQPGIPIANYKTTFNLDAAVPRLLPLVPGDASYQALIEATYAAGQINVTWSEYTALNSYGGDTSAHWASWWNNGNPTGNTGAGAWRSSVQAAIPVQQHLYNDWHNWATPIEAAHQQVPTLAQWQLSPGTKEQREQYWYLWSSYHPGASGTGAFLAAWLADAAAGNVVPTPPPGADYLTWSELVASWGVNPPTETVYRAYVNAGGNANQHVHDYALIHFGSASAYTNYATALETDTLTGSLYVPIQGGEGYQTFARSVLAIDQSPPSETAYDQYQSSGFSAALAIPLWQEQGTNSGYSSFAASFAQQADAMALAGKSQLNTCCNSPPSAPCLGHVWATSSIYAWRNIDYTVSVQCGQCTHIVGSMERRCIYNQDGNTVPVGCTNATVITPWDSVEFELGNCGTASSCAPHSCTNFMSLGVQGGGRAPDCLEVAMLSLGCVQPVVCGGKTLDCVLCMVSSGCGNCSGCNGQDPPPCDTSTDADCNGCLDADEPCDDPCPGYAACDCPGDKDCDDCPDDRDVTPEQPGGTCNDPDPEECEGDADCDDCPDDEEGGAGGMSGNPACQCDTTPGDGENDDHDCDGCPEDFDNETRTRTNQDCGPCKDKGGDSDRDGCCDDDDAESHSETGDENNGCEDCTQDIVQKIEELSQRIAGRWMPALAIGEANTMSANVNLSNLDGTRLQWRIDFMTGMVEGTFADPGMMAGASDALMSALAQARALEAFVIVCLGVLTAWYILNSLGGGSV